MVETKYNSDAADPQVNTSSLDEAFGIDNVENNEKQLIKVQEMRTTLENLDDEASTDTILLENVERANRLLDKLETTIIDGGDTSARLFEVAATLMNAVSQATAGIVGAGNDAQKNDMQMRIVTLKEQEFELKKMIQGKKVNEIGSPITNNILVTDRESLLKMIKEQKEEEENN
jgi:hypothetical protein